MALNKVKEYFEKFQMANRIKEFPVSSATVELAAFALGCEPERIAKTLSFELKDRSILIVTAGDQKINNSKFKEEFQEKAKMISGDLVENKIGHAVGGVCPFAVLDSVDIYLDISLKRFCTVFPACGSSNSAIELSISELEEYSNFIKWVDVCKNKEEN